MSLRFLPYTRQSIQDADIQSVATALQGDIITRGEHVKNFEQEIARYCDAQYAVAFNNGTAALMAAYFAADLSPFDRIITTPNSFIATIGAPIQMGLTPHFVDIDRSTGNLDLSLLKEMFHFTSSRGKPIIVPVHFSGIPVDMQQLEVLTHAHPNAVIIEDAAHAIGSTYSNGKKVGSCEWSHLTIFSFHPAKTITTGEGGVVTTNDPELYHRLQLYRNNGIEREAPYLKQEAKPGYYEVHTISGNFHLTDLQAALGISQLKRIEQFIQHRRRLILLYRELLKDLKGIRFLSNGNDHQIAFHLCVIQVDFAAYHKTRETVMNRLHAKGIGTQVHYIPLYHHPVLAHLREKETSACPEMEQYYKEALSLPLYYDLTEEDVERVCKELKHILRK